MKLDHKIIDQSWLNRLSVSDKKSDYIITGCDYWKRGGEEDLAFMYHSDHLTLVSCSPEMAETISSEKPRTLSGFANEENGSQYEVYIDDVDYYLFENKNDCESLLEVVELSLEKDRSYIESFIDACAEEDLIKSDFDIDSDYFYAVVKDNEVAGMLASYCGVEPFESLSIVVNPRHRGLGVGKSLLYRLIDEAEKRNRVVRYRTNRENKSSIKLCESMGFTQHSSIQVLAKL
ncbi:GNAT family N-acetyltransferase [Endozoicomonas arenosclerae]|uniref:GNAT family N-acetyltransferase n=1 Tax=Endozoicomonas arenosclerae TaxID=1633495 RepID=UPI00078674D5|nr:GNAT family N-acetyltransferase [Endozoicomonas arenosclerae]